MTDLSIAPGSIGIGCEIDSELWAAFVTAHPDERMIVFGDGPLVAPSGRPVQWPS